MMKYTVLAAVVMTAMVGCAKQQPQNESASSVKETAAFKNASEQKPDSAANPSNPYDDYGRFHNEGMAYVIGAMQKAGDTRPESVSRYVRAFSTLKTGKPDNNDYYGFYVRNMKDSANFFAERVAKAKLSPKGVIYLQSIFAVITKRAAMDTFNYVDVKAEIMVIEQQIMRDGALPSPDTKELLKAGSLARYSSYYWTQITPPEGKNIFRKILFGLVGICADLSCLDAICGPIINYIDGGEYGPIDVSSTIYFGMLLHL